MKLMILHLSGIINAIMQDDQLPNFMLVIFSKEMIANITATISTTKLVRNFLGNIKGKWALYITGVVGLGIGIVQYWADYGYISIIIGLSAGLVSAGVFKGAKLVGKNIKKKKKK